MSFAGFANALGLLGLLSLPLVLVLHLLRQRTQEYTVSSLTLWKFLEEEVRGSRLQRIPLTWLLVADLLIATLLSLAWAQPQVTTVDSVPQPRQLILLLDTSTSMGARDAYPSRFDVARESIRQMLSGLRPIDRAVLIAFDSEPHWVGDTSELPMADLISQLDTLQLSEVSTQGVAPALAMAEAAISSDYLSTVAVFTDGAYPEPHTTGLSYQPHWQVLGASGDNQAVLDLSIVPAGYRNWQVFMRAANFGREPVNQVATLWLDGQEANAVFLSIESQSTETQVWAIDRQPKDLAVTLADSDDLSMDNSRTLGLQQRGLTRVALVSSEPGLLLSALEALESVDLTQLTPDQYLPGLPFDVIVFHGFLPEAWAATKNIVIDPPAGTALLPINDELALVEGQTTMADAPVLQGVDLSGVRWAQTSTLDAPLPDSQVLMEASVPLLLSFQDGTASGFVLLPELNGGNITRHPAFPILINNLVYNEAAGELPDSLTLGQTLALPDGERYPEIAITGPDGETTLVSRNMSRLWEGMTEPGLYELMLTDIDGRVEQTSLGVNASGLAEGDILPRQWTEQLPQPTLALGPEMREEEQVHSLAPWVLGLAALILLVEAWLAWR